MKGELYKNITFMCIFDYPFLEITILQGVKY